MCCTILNAILVLIYLFSINLDYIQSKPSTVMCYTCRKCNEVTSNTPAVACMRGCCYRALIRNNGDAEYFAVRDCIDVQVCTQACKFMKSEHLKAYPDGDVSVCITCDSVDSDGCNDEVYNRAMIEIPRTTTEKPDYFLCYECTRCNVLKRNSYKVRCKSPDCCYLALVHERDGEPSYAVRGCVEGATCSHTCKYIKHKHLLEHPDGAVDICMTCNENEDDRCNKNDYYPGPRTTTVSYITCYYCVDCHAVTVGTPTKLCYEGACFTLVWSKYGVTNSAKGCAEFLGKPVGDYCPHTIKLLESDSSGKVHLCKVCFHDLCNTHDISMFMSTTTIASYIKCFTCNDCHRVTGQSETCLSNCCYITVWLADGLGETHRGCADDCYNYCKNLMQSADYDILHYCKVCNTDECNDIEITMDSHHPIDCYKCDNCYDITKLTPLEKCPNKCCISLDVILLDIHLIIRRCERKVRCSEICMNFRSYVQHFDAKGTVKDCSVCSKNKCNARSFQRALTTPPPFIPCYTGRNTTSNCRTKCCYTAVWLDSGSLKGCAQTNNCNDYCNSLNKKGLSYCLTCMTAYCNNERINEDTHLPEGIIVHNFMCYHCSDCYVVTDGTTRDICRTNCCFTSTTHLSISRGCGLDCNEHCDGIKDNIYCSVCKTDSCNNEEISRDTKQPIDIIDCYVCENCYEINKCSLKSPCASKCCSTIKYTMFDYINVVRKCESDCKNPCKRTQNDISRFDSHAEVNYCNVCNTNNCNNQILPYNSSEGIVQCYNCRKCFKVTPETRSCRCSTKTCVTITSSASGVTRECIKDFPIENYCKKKGVIYCNICSTKFCNNEQINPHTNIPDITLVATTQVPPPSKPIQCLTCANCNVVTANTKTIVCPNCCATVVWLVESFAEVVRQCTGSCDQYCEKISPTIDHHLKYCKSCRYDRCNSESFDTNGDLLIINCYECANCSSTSSLTNVCPNGCCYTAQITVNNIVKTVRDCAHPQNIPCANYCNYINQTLPRDATLTHCSVCTTNKCNNKIIHPVTQPPRLTINCYRCHNCYAVTHQTNSEQCTSQCCSTIDTMLLGFRMIARRCETASKCNEVCTDAQENLQRFDPNAVLEYCKVCDRNKCNHEEFEHRQVTTTIATTQLTTVKKRMYCYKCYKCNSITYDTNAIESACCSTIIVVMHGVRIVTRDGEDKLPCWKVCVEIVKQIKRLDVNGVLDYCRVCRRNLCNKKEFTLISFLNGSNHLGANWLIFVVILSLFL